MEKSTEFTLEFNGRVFHFDEAQRKYRKLTYEMLEETVDEMLHAWNKEAVAIGATRFVLYQAGQLVA